MFAKITTSYMKGVDCMMDYNFISKLSFDDLKEYLVVCYYACDHDSADLIMYEMERKYPEKYYDLLYGED